jgi:hypothetical protein
VLTVLKTSIEAEPITDVANVGDVALTLFPLPVEVSQLGVLAVPLDVRTSPDAPMLEVRVKGELAPLRVSPDEALILVAVIPP